MIKKCMIAILLSHAVTSAWFLFPVTEHQFISGYPIGVTEQWFVKGFCDCLLRLTYATVICLIMRRYEPRLVLFFYVTFWYYFLNLGFYWYNYCQWRFPFYIMWICLLMAVIKLNLRKEMKIVK